MTQTITEEAANHRLVATENPRHSRDILQRRRKHAANSNHAIDIN
jgi:hypothetical protein